MNKDLDLMRKILLKIDSKITESTGSYRSAFSISRSNADFQFEGYTWDQVALNLDLLLDEHCIDGDRSISPQDFAIFRLTSRGYDFADSVRDDGIWEKAKNLGQQAGRVGFEMPCGIAKGLLKQKLKETFGVDLG